MATLGEEAQEPAAHPAARDPGGARCRARALRGRRDRLRSRARTRPARALRVPAGRARRGRHGRAEAGHGHGRRGRRLGARRQPRRRAGLPRLAARHPGRAQPHGPRDGAGHASCPARSAASRRARARPWSPRRASPALAIAAVLLLDPAWLVGFSATCVLVYYAIAHLAALRQPRAERWLNRAVPIAGALGCALLAFTLPWQGVLIAARRAGHRARRRAASVWPGAAPAPEHAERAASQSETARSALVDGPDQWASSVSGVSTAWISLRSPDHSVWKVPSWSTRL